MPIPKDDQKSMFEDITDSFEDVFQTPQTTEDTDTPMDDASDEVGSTATTDTPDDQGEPASDDANVVVSEDDEIDYDACQATNAEQVQLRTSVEWLVGLKRSIGAEGVSRSDVQAILEIQKQVDTVSQETFTAPSLEHYPVGMFTQNRSQLNLTVAQEALDQTIVATIRRWIGKLMEYLRRFITWWRKVFYTEEFYQDSLEVLAGRIQLAQTKISQLRHSYVRMDDKAEKSIRAEQTTVLSDVKIPRSELAQAALRDDTAMTNVGSLVSRLETVSTRLTNGAVSLNKFLTGKEEELDVTEVTAAQDALATLNAELNDKNQASNQIKLKFDKLVDNLNTPLHPTAAKVVPFYYLFLNASYINDQLKQIRKIDVEAELVDATSQHMASLSRGVEQIGNIALILQTYNGYRVSVLVAQYRALLKELETLSRIGTSQLLNERSKQKVMDLVEEFRATIKKRYAMPN